MNKIEGHLVILESCFQVFRENYVFIDVSRDLF